MNSALLKKGEKHLTATVFVVSLSQPPKVLLIHHKKLGVWLPPGGHVERNENPHQAALREVLEETGIDISQYFPKPQRVDDRAVAQPLPNFFFEEHIAAHGDQPMHFHLDCIFVVTLPRTVTLIGESKLDHEIGWFSQQEVKKLAVFENVSFLLKKILTPMQSN